MATKTYSIRMREEIKKEFDKICHDFGMNPSTAINVFAHFVVREKRVPFEILISYSSDYYSTERALRILDEVREKAERDGLSDMSLEEINAEIDAAREERIQREKFFNKSKSKRKLYIFFYKIFRKSSHNKYIKLILD